MASGRLDVLITGVGGIVGSSVYSHLAQYPDRYRLFGLGRRRALSARVLDGRRLDLPDERFHRCDLQDAPGLAQAAKGMDAVVHLAADPGDGDWDSLLRANIVGAQNVFEACRQAGVRRLIAASTIQVSTGNQQASPVYSALASGALAAMPAHTPRLSAEVPAEPRNLYAATKVFAESLCRVYAGQGEMSCLAIRIGWVVSEDRPLHHRGDIWCSQVDIARLVRCCLDAPADLRLGIFYGMSECRRRWVDLENARQLVGYLPQDRAEEREGAVAG